jgi:signal transduction histidine kinase
MHQNSIEPGLLQIFRFYAWLRLVSLILFPLAFLFGRLETIPITSFLPAVILTLVDNLLLLFYLHIGWLERRLAGWFVPLALMYASASLLIEQQIFSIHTSFWQVQFFLAVLLILVAWQYTLREVVLFIFTTGFFEVVLNLVFPMRDIILIGPVDKAGIFIPYALLVSRLAAYLVVGFVVNRLARAARERLQALAEANQKLVSHAGTLEQLTVSRERVRMSRELHDTLAHSLSALVVQLDAILVVWSAAPVKAREMLEHMLGTTRSGLDETRRALNALRASPLEEMGLVGALRLMVEDFAERCHLELKLDTPDELNDLSPDVEQCFYRVAQEILENISRHASARRLEVRLNQTATSCEMSFRDDGKGFDPDQVTQDDQLGLVGMRERAEIIGANLSIESRPGQGTTVRLNLENVK